MSRAVRLRAALVAASAATALLVSEAGLRLQAMADRSLDTQARRSRPSRWPDVVYELKPGLRGLFRGQPMSTNVHGLRGPEVSLAKPPGVFRIAGLGDSQMFGWGVSDEEVYLRRVERALNARAAGGGTGGTRRFEVLNFAVPGYNTVMEVATFEHKGLAFSPDLVVLHYVRNDLDAPHYAPAAGEPASYLLARLRGVLAAREDAVLREAAGGRRARRAASRRPYARLGGRAPFDRAVDRLAVLCSRRSIPVIVLTLRAKRDPVLYAAVRRNRLRHVEAAPRFWAHLGSQGLAETDGAWAPTFRTGRDGHTNALGHRLLAEVLLAELEALGVASG